MRFNHQIWVLHSNGSAIIASFWTRNSFNRAAYNRFREEALQRWSGMRRVRDTTVAGFHYSNADGSVCLELR
jgi:hypothetical protein